MAAAKRVPTRRTTVDRMTEAEVRLLLKEVVRSARAGARQGSASDVGEMVIDDLEKAGIRVP